MSGTIPTMTSQLFMEAKNKLGFVYLGNKYCVNKHLKFTYNDKTCQRMDMLKIDYFHQIQQKKH